MGCTHVSLLCAMSSRGTFPGVRVWAGMQRESTGEVPRAMLGGCAAPRAVCALCVGRVTWRLGCLVRHAGLPEHAHLGKAPQWDVSLQVTTCPTANELGRTGSQSMGSQSLAAGVPAARRACTLT
jgi:hypothetical protein